MEQARDFVNGIAINRTDDSLKRDISKQGDFTFFVFWDFTLSTAQQNIRLNTDFA